MTNSKNNSANQQNANKGCNRTNEAKTRQDNRGSKMNSPNPKSTCE